LGVEVAPKDPKKTKRLGQVGHDGVSSLNLVARDYELECVSVALSYF